MLRGPVGPNGSAFAEEEVFEAALDESLGPRGFDLLAELVAELGLPPGSAALDVGAREAYFCIELARRFGFTVHGIEPVRRHLVNAARGPAVVMGGLHGPGRQPDVLTRYLWSGPS